MTGPVVAPQIPAYANRTPYITAAEFLASPTGVDVTQLVPGGTQQSNAAALAAVIARASSWADSLCYQVLAATVDVQAGRYRIRSDGSIRIPLPYTPIVQVNSLQAGYTPDTMAALDLAGAWIGPKTVTLWPYGSITIPPYWVGAGRQIGGGDLYAVVQYVNGYANTVTTAASSAGATQLAVSSTPGMVPGLQLTVADGAATELVTVLAAGDNSITTTTLANAHNAGVSVTALPQSVKQSVICLTSALIKTRGAEAVTMASLSQEPSKVDGMGAPGGFEDVEIAVDLLEPFKRVT